jgi:hypothetical protein
VAIASAATGLSRAGRRITVRQKSNASAGDCDVGGNKEQRIEEVYELRHSDLLGVGSQDDVLVVQRTLVARK